MSGSELFSRHPRWTLAALTALVFALVTHPVHAERTDEVVLSNGNAITGEVKELVQGKLRYKTDDMGTIYIEWAKVIKLTSKDFFEVETQLGVHYYGSLVPGPSERTLEVTDETQSMILDMARIAKITPIKMTFWGRIDGSLNLGFSFTSRTLRRTYSLT